jgi:hypothetical protein
MLTVPVLQRVLILPPVQLTVEHKGQESVFVVEYALSRVEYRYEPSTHAMGHAILTSSWGLTYSGNLLEIKILGFVVLDHNAVELGGGKHGRH